jgi:hypothetical protein
MILIAPKPGKSHEPDRCLDAMKDAAKPDAALDPAPEEIEIKLAASAKMLEQLRHHPRWPGRENVTACAPPISTRPMVRWPRARPVCGCAAGPRVANRR